MPKGENITTKFTVDISDLKKGIRDATQQIRLADAEFKAATAGMTNWSKSAEGLKAKLTQLKSTLEANKAKLENYTKQLQAQKSAYDENGKRAEALKAQMQELVKQGVSPTSKEYKLLEQQLSSVEKEQLKNEKSINALNVTILQQEAAVKKTQGEIGKYENALNDLEREQREAAEAANRQKSAYEQLEDTIADQQKRLDELKGKYSSVVLEQGKNSDSAKELAGEIDKLSGELAENQKAMRDADKAADELDKSLDDIDPEETAGGFTVLKGALANLVADGIRAAISAIQDFAKETINVGKEFDKSMSNVAALSGATGDELQMLRDTAKEFGSTTQFSASEAADALGYMALAGWDANQSADALGGVLNLAAASGMDLAEASDMVTDYMSAFGMEAQESAKFADLLAYAQANANTTAGGLGEAFKNSAAVMNAGGQDIETVTSLLAMMANQGLKGSEAGTALTAVMRDMTNKMKDGAIAIGDTTVQVMDANGNYRDLTDILADVEAATNGMGDAQKASALSSTFTADSIKGLNLILNAGVGEAADFEEQLRNSSGSAEEMSKIMNDNLNGDLTALGSKLEGVQIALYEKFEPALRAGVDALSGLLDKFQWVIDHGETITAIIIGVGTAVGTFLAIVNRQAILTAFIGLISKLKAGFLAFNAVLAANPIGLVISLIAGLVAAFVYLWNTSEDFRNFWIGLWDKIKSFVGDAVEAIGTFFSELWTGIKEIWATVAQWFNENVIQPVVEFFSGLATSVSGFFSDLWTGIKEIWATVAQWFNDKVVKPVKAFFAPLVQWFTDLFQSIWDFIASVFEVIGQLAEGCVLIIQQAWGIVAGWFDEKVIQPLTTFFTDLWEAIRLKAKASWDKIVYVWNVVATWFDTNVIQPVTKFFSDLWTGVSTAASKAWDGIVEVWQKVSGWFDTTVIQPVSTFFSDAWTKLKNGASDAWTGIKNVFKKIPEWFESKFKSAWTKVKNVFSTGGKIFDGIKEGITAAFKTVVNKIIGGINKVIAKPFNAINKVLDKIRGVSILGITPFSGLGSISVPQIPLLAKGGVLKRGQVGLLEGDGAEAVVPLDRNKAWIRSVAQSMLRELSRVSSTGAGIVNNRNTRMSEYSFTQNIYAPKQPSRIELYRQTRNLLAYASGGTENV